MVRKKIRAVVKAKAERSERVSTQIPYGYKKDPYVKGHLLIDKETATIVRRIFDLCAQGMVPTNIGNVLSKDKAFKPKETRCIGHTVNCRTRVISYKDKRQVEVPKNGQYRFENTHEAIIDQEMWDAVQKVREGKRRRNNMG